MKNFQLLISSLLFLCSTLAIAQNPIIRNQFSADPTARVFKDRIYVFPSHDIPAPPNKNLRKDWFCMEDYHVFSSENMIEWTDHGTIVTQSKVPWVDSLSYSMWAPDCIERHGTYYFYFPANRNIADSDGKKSFGIGVATSNSPKGPYKVLPIPIKGVNGIDPNVFIDHDGQAYLYWALGDIFVAKLKDNMTEIASEPQVIANLPQIGLKEGPFLFERNGIYYLTFPHVANKIERLEYAIATNPLGPFKMAGVIMDESPMNCWTNHQSLVQYKKQWYLFYHQDAYSPSFDKNRSICIDSLSFNPDNTIRKVIPSLRGVGVTSAKNKIEIDRYSGKSENGLSIAFLDSHNPFLGWKTIFSGDNSWVKYNAVDFGRVKLGKIKIQACSSTGGTLQIRLDKSEGPILAEVEIPKSSDWNLVESPTSDYQSGLHHLVVIQKGNNKVEVDWLKFE